MKKAALNRLCIYGLLGLSSLTVFLSTNTYALTKVASSTSTFVPDSAFIWPTQGMISRGFQSSSHPGIDIAGVAGVPVVAAASGKVIKAGWDDWGFGNYIRIRHPNGSVTVYGHNRRLLVSKGQEVALGQTIAEMGSTGNSTAPHLHFEVHPNGIDAVDPIRLLSTRNPANTIPPELATVSNQTQSLPVMQPIPLQRQVAMGVQNNVGCGGVTVISGETANALVKVCQENGQLSYIGQLKQNPTPIRLSARNIGADRYRADNGSYSYFVSPKGVEVWHDGHEMRFDSFYAN